MIETPRYHTLLKYCLTSDDFTVKAKASMPYTLIRLDLLIFNWTSPNVSTIGATTQPKALYFTIFLCQPADDFIWEKE